ncbi:MAG: endonuclease/exonuclease/phosphatase family protein [Chthoniobacterales bacterium]
MRTPIVLRALVAIGLAAAGSHSFAQAPAAPAGATEITATFWNIQWFPGRRPNATRGEEQRQIGEVHREAAQFHCDVIGMEEVRDWHAAELAVQPLAGFKVDVCSTFPPREGQTDTQQVAIASKLQPLSAWAESWKVSGAIAPPRGFAFAAYQLAPKQLVLVYAVHLKSNRGEIHEDIAIREESIRQLVSHITAMNNAYGKLGAITWIIGGDFNTSPDELRFRAEKTVPAVLANGFDWAWKNVPMASRITMPPDVRFPAASFDQIFYRGATLVRAWVSQTSPRASDHRAVNVTLALR